MCIYFWRHNLYFIDILVYVVGLLKYPSERWTVTLHWWSMAGGKWACTHHCTYRDNVTYGGRRQVDTLANTADKSTIDWKFIHSCAVTKSEKGIQAGFASLRINYGILTTRVQLILILLISETLYLKRHDLYQNFQVTYSIRCILHDHVYIYVRTKLG